ncbi:Predicted secreted protein [Mycobacteroides abscessus subsp. abscessus]|nr:Predicted secreted protein [Mycobacteroides abscessus subsp. abscessus]
MKLLKWICMVALAFVVVSSNQMVYASTDSNDEESINEKFGLPIVVYGAALSDSQKAEVRELLEIKDTSKVTEITVTGEDLVYYIDGDKNSNMYSSAKITRKEKGEGLVINQVTPENITEVTSEMYANALLTAGIEDAVVDVASPVKVSGHSALVGIYKAYDEGEGTELNQERTEVANEELTLATDLAKKEGLDEDKVSELLTEIKKEIAEQKPATKEELEQLIDEKLQTLNVQLSAEDRQLLIDLFEKMRNLNINFDNVQSQLEDLSKDIQNRIENAISENKGFLDTIANFFKSFIDSLKSLFS